MKTDAELIAEGRALWEGRLRALRKYQDGGSLDHYLDESDSYGNWHDTNIDRLLDLAAQAETAEKDAARLREALNAIMIKPYGCRFCHSGKLIKPNDPEKDHDDDCGFLLARAAIANEQEAT